MFSKAMVAYGVSREQAIENAVALIKIGLFSLLSPIQREGSE
jgi:hypothetical protein